MYTLKVRNSRGQVLELTNNDKYVITDIIGLDPPDAVINLTRNANDNGSIFNSAYIDNRVITITLAVNYPAETNRILLYKYFQNKNSIRIFYKNGIRDVYIDGYVQKFNVQYFGKKEIVQITILCPDPLLKSKTDTVEDFSVVQNAFEFPFYINENEPIAFSVIDVEAEHTIYNAGDLNTDFSVTFRAEVGSVYYPRITNGSTLEYFEVNQSMSPGDEIIINFKKKNRSVYLVSNGTETSLVGKISSTSKWLTLMPGDNVFTISAQQGSLNLRCYVTMTEQYEGV